MTLFMFLEPQITVREKMKILLRWCADPNGERLFGAAKPRQGEQEGKA